MSKSSFLVVYDYGQGGVWAFVAARSSDEITAKYPEVKVVDEAPSWMNDELKAHIERTNSHDLDEEPAGFLKEIVNARSSG